VICPVCANVELRMSERQGVEIDYCPKCRGVWLDRGELDKLIELSVSQLSPGEDRRPSSRDDDDDDPRFRRRRRKSVLGELFDF